MSLKIPFLWGSMLPKRLASATFQKLYYDKSGPVGCKTSINFDINKKIRPYNHLLTIWEFTGLKNKSS